METTQWLYLILVVAVLAFGLGVLIISRRRSSVGQAPPTRTSPPSIRPAPAPAPTAPTASAPTAPAAPAHTAEPDGTDVVVVEPVEPIVPVEPVSLRVKMGKARAALAGAIAGVRSRTAITEETWEELSDALLLADVGVGVAEGLIADLRNGVRDNSIGDPEALLEALRVQMAAQLIGSDRTLHLDADLPGPNIWMFVGVNGVGKTTTIGKVAQQQIDAGRSVLLAAGDTFRAAAAEQLQTWAQRSGAEFVRGAEGSDPSSVIFDGVERAAARSLDLVLADTAGRLHTKTNLMDELRKVRRVAEKGSGRVTETLLVIDATTGQNGLVQARQFAEATGLTGVVLTKLDGSAKGGIVFAIETELQIPVKLVGIGEQIGDLVPFDPAEFVAALFDA